MKKIFLMSFVLLPCFAFAQFSKGQIYLGGTMSVSLSRNNTPGTSATNYYGSTGENNIFAISPVLGFFLNPKIAIGGSIGYSTSFISNNSYETYHDINSNNTAYVPTSNKTTSNSIVLSSFARYYIPIMNSFYFVAQGQILFTRANSKTNYSGIQSYNNNVPILGETSANNPYYSIGANIKPVLVFFPSPKWSIEASAGSISYGHTQYLPNTYSVNTFAMSAGTFSFGLAYYFKRKLE